MVMTFRARTSCTPFITVRNWISRTFQKRVFSSIKLASMAEDRYTAFRAKYSIGCRRFCPGIRSSHFIPASGAKSMPPKIDPTLGLDARYCVDPRQTRYQTFYQIRNHESDLQYCCYCPTRSRTSDPSLTISNLPRPTHPRSPISSLVCLILQPSFLASAITWWRQTRMLFSTPIPSRISLIKAKP